MNDEDKLKKFIDNAVKVLEEIDNKIEVKDRFIEKLMMVLKEVKEIREDIERGNVSEYRMKIYNEIIDKIQIAMDDIMAMWGIKNNE